MKTQLKLTQWGMFAILVATISTGNAQVVYDGFQTGTNTSSGEYVDGNNASGTTNGGSGWSQSSWTNASPRLATGTATGLSYSDGSGNTLVTAAGGISSPSGSGNLTFERDFTTTTTGSEVWFSVLMDRNSIAAGFEDTFAFQLRSQTGGLKYSIRAVDNQSTWAASYVPNSGSETIAQITGTTYDANTFFVGQITNIGTASSTFNIWFNPNDLTNLGAANWTSGTFTSQNIGRVTLRTDGNRVGTFDEVRIGNTVGDVVVIPEPTTYSLVGLAGLLLFALRRFQK